MFDILVPPSSLVSSMPEFFNVLPPQQALHLLLDRLAPLPSKELILTSDAFLRITAQPVHAPEHLPSFPRSAMDGYAVRSQDTFGASEALPAYLELVGDVPAGRDTLIVLAPGQTATAYTGGPLAGGADAVVMVELTQRAGDATIEVLRPAAPGENVVQVGEDTRQGDLVLPQGHLIRPQDIGGLLGLGVTQLPVTPRPRVAIVSTGDELVSPQMLPGPARVRDINTYTLSAQVSACGALPISAGLVPDDYEVQLTAAQEGLSLADVLLFSAGSSVSSHDMTVDIIAALGQPGVLFHGISFKPGKPTIGAIVEGKPVFGLPGNPVSAMVVFDMLVRPVLYALAGCSEPPPRATATARLTRDIPSQSGREDYVPVRLISHNGALTAEPVFGKSNLIYTLVRADGMLRVPLDAGGVYAGQQVTVTLF